MTSRRSRRRGVRFDKRHILKDFLAANRRGRDSIAPSHKKSQTACEAARDVFKPTSRGQRLGLKRVANPAKPKVFKGNLQDKRAGKPGCRRQFVLTRASWRLYSRGPAQPSLLQAPRPVF